MADAGAGSKEEMTATKTFREFPLPRGLAFSSPTDQEVELCHRHSPQNQSVIG